jgi:molybdopterin converting factor subunit 1
MQIRLLFFASYRDLMGTGEITLTIPEGTDVAGVVAEVRALGGGAERLPSYPVLAVNEEYASDDRVVREGDVVAFIPPVAGG